MTGGIKKLYTLLFCAVLLTGCQFTPKKEIVQLSPSDTVVADDGSDECFLNENCHYVARGLDDQTTEYNYTQADVLSTIYFNFDSSILMPSYQQHMIDVSKILAKNPDVSVLLVGHCDKFGKEQYNLRLGKLRSESVRDALLELGIEQSRIKTASLGSSRADCKICQKTDGARDRRCDIVLLK